MGCGVILGVGTVVCVRFVGCGECMVSDGVLKGAWGAVKWDECGE
jgi:hypothetical protein